MLNDEQFLDTILKSTFTRNDIARRMRLLREYLEQNYFTETKMEMTKFLLLRRATTDDINAFIGWGEEFYATFTRKNAYTLISRMLEEAKKLPVASLYIPYEPVPAEVSKIGVWFRGNVGSNVLLDIHTDPTLLGGCAIVWKGSYRDYSLRYYMLKKHQEIVKVIEEYVSSFYKISN